MSEILKVKDFNKGAILKQGDSTTLKYYLYDADEEQIESIIGKTAEVVFIKGGQVYYRTSGVISDLFICEFKIEEVLPTGVYHIEFLVDGHIFPSGDKPYFTLTASSKGINNQIITAHGFEEVVVLALEEVESRSAARLAELESNYATRLTGLSAQMAQKANQAFVDAQLSSIVSGAPKGTYTNLASLQSAYPNGSEGIFLVIENGHWYYWNESTLSWSDGGVYQSTGIGKNTITPDETTFIITSSNLLDTRNLKLGFTLDGSGQEVANGNRSVTGKIKVKKGVPYTFIGVNRIVFYDIDDNVLLTRLWDLPNVVNTVTTPANVDYIRISLFNSFIDQAQLNEGSALLPFETFSEPILSDEIKIEALDEALNEVHTEIHNVNQRIGYVDNIFKNESIVGGYISEGDWQNTIVPGAGRTTEYVEVESGGTYTVKAKGVDTTTSLHLAFSNHIEVGAVFERVAFLTSQRDERIATVHNVNNHKYLLIKAEDTSRKKAEVFVYKSDTLPTETPIIKIDNVEIVKKTDLDKIKLDRYSSYYESPVLEPIYPATATEIYNLYETLMSQSEGYITKRLLGKDAQNNDIFEYKFAKEEVENDFEILKPVIGITSGVHGNEKGPVAGLFHFMKALTLNESENEIMNKIKSNMNFSIIPISCPTGYNANNRLNWNGVNINRNFDYKWEEYTTTNDKGASPASELETQILQNWMAENSFDQYLDYHTADMGVDGHATWFVGKNNGSHDLEMQKEYFRVLTLISTVWSNKHDILPNNTNFGRIPVHTDAPFSYNYYSTLGGRGALLEVSETWKFYPTDGEKLQHRVTFPTELIGNYIFEVAKRYI